MFGGRNKKRARKREEREKQHSKQKKQRKRNESHRKNAAAASAAATTTSTSTSNTTSTATDTSTLAPGQVREPPQQDVLSSDDDADEAPLEPKMSRSKRKKLERLAQDREKKKQRSSLFEQLKQNAISSSQQQFLEKTSQMGQSATLKQRLKGDLMKQRAGLEIDAATSRLAVAGSSASNSSVGSGKWSKHSLEVTHKIARPFGVSSSDGSDSESDDGDDAMSMGDKYEEVPPIKDVHADEIIVRAAIVEKNAAKKQLVDSYAPSSSSSTSSSTSS
jgi:hypothetical protein